MTSPGARRAGDRGLPFVTRLHGLQVATLAWLTVVWVALWGGLSSANVLGGLVVALVVCLVFPLPPLRVHLRIRPLRLLWLLLRFVGDVVVASVQVAWVTVQFRRQPRNAVIEVDLCTDSDFVLTVVAEMVSLVPGSLVVEARRSTHTLYLHVFDVRNGAGIDRMRSQVLGLERRVVLALGADTRDVRPPADPVTRSTSTGGAPS
ncbi:MAG: Na+/H+ antiporter subunit E [Actinomycetales bacterium]|nr:Na+/H+ antiporter subunit E [Actinomycetales bacterium]